MKSINLPKLDFKVSGDNLAKILWVFLKEKRASILKSCLGTLILL